MTPSVQSLTPILDRVAGQVTEAAILHVLMTGQGHRNIPCTVEELQLMESDIQTCLRDVKYQIRCLPATRGEQCRRIETFIDDCTHSALGEFILCVNISISN